MEQELPTTIDEYIAGQNPEIQPILGKLYQTIKEAAPEATEKISWGMATFVYHGNLVHFSAEKKHIGFHPAPSAIIAFQEELKEYRYSKGTVQFPYDKPLPYELIERMVRFRTAEQAALFEEKKAGKTKEKTLRPCYPMPDDIMAELQKEDLAEAYDARPPYQKNDYIGWITRARRPETRRKRIDQMLDELRSGDAYMGMAYSPKKSTKTGPS
ncbi:DUF1801 domain-containing protein [Lacrimispora sp.]|uniref:DUF1801 domain-containing protein n=1 Tax=Lacrimispora sp. TaxID=2719234 RepID=UPI0028A5A990|nr:DUF1801 domain-containing protein [Lacrimispora sp.]